MLLTPRLTADADDRIRAIAAEYDAAYQRYEDTAAKAMQIVIERCGSLDLLRQHTSVDDAGLAELWIEMHVQTPAVNLISSATYTYPVSTWKRAAATYRRMARDLDRLTSGPVCR